MGDVGKAAEGFVSGVGNFLGLGGEQELGGGGNFAMTQGAAQGEQEALQRMRDRASGANSVTELRYKQAMDDMIRAQQSGAASARGVSNQALLNRNVAQAGQQAQLEMTREVAAQKLAEQQAADAGLIQAAAGQRGVALSAASQEAQLAEAAGQRRAGFIANLAGSGAKMAAGGKAYGGKIEGEEIVEGDSLENDVIPTNLSAGEIVIPKSAAKDKESVMKFLDAIKAFDSNKSDSDESESVEDHSVGMAKLLEEMAEMKKLIKKKA